MCAGNTFCYDEVIYYDAISWHQLWDIELFHQILIWSFNMPITRRTQNRLEGETNPNALISFFNPLFIPKPVFHLRRLSADNHNVCLPVLCNLKTLHLCFPKSQRLKMWQRCNAAGLQLWDGHTHTHRDRQTDTHTHGRTHTHTHRHRHRHIHTHTHTDTRTHTTQPHTDRHTHRDTQTHIPD